MAKRKQSKGNGGGTAVAEKRRPCRPPKSAREDASNGEAAPAEQATNSAPERPKRGRNARQQDLIPDAFERIKEIEDAAESYEEARDERIALLAIEKNSKKTLIEVMGRHNRKLYKTAEYEVELDHREKDNVKMKRKSVEGEEEEEGDED